MHTCHAHARLDLLFERLDDERAPLVEPTERGECALRLHCGVHL